MGKWKWNARDCCQKIPFKFVNKLYEQVFNAREFRLKKVQELQGLCESKESWDNYVRPRLSQDMGK